MLLSKEQIVKLAEEVLRRYTEKYGAPADSPTVRLKGNTTRIGSTRFSNFTISPSVKNSMGSKPPAGMTMKPLGGAGGGLGKGTGGTGAKI